MSAYQKAKQMLDNDNSVNSSDLDYEQDLEKLKNLYNQTKKESQKQQPKELKSTVRDSKSIINKQINDKLNHQVQSLQEQLLQSRQTIDSLNNKIIELSHDNHELKQMQNKQSDQYHQKSSLVQNMQGKHFQQMEEQNKIFQRTQETMDQLYQEIEFKDEQIKKLRESLDDCTKNLSVARVSQQSNWEKRYENQKQVEQNLKSMSSLNENLRQQKQENINLLLEKKAEGAFLIEVEHLRADVKRLIQMLRQTKEFKDFADFADDHGQSIRFLKEIQRPSMIDAKDQCRNCQVQRPCFQLETNMVDEKMLWIPEAAFQFLQAFRLKYNGELTETLCNDLLFELNKIWHAKEQAQIKRIKSFYAHEAEVMRLKIHGKPNYNEISLLETIKRLKNQLKIALKENREAFGERQSRNPQGTKYVSETLKLARDNQRDKKRCETLNNNLKEKLELISQNSFEENATKAQFMRGANWMVHNVLSECTHLNEELDDLKALYIQGGDVDDEFHLFENTDRAIKNFINVIQNMKENTQKQAMDAQQEVQKVGLKK